MLKSFAVHHWLNSVPGPCFSEAFATRYRVIAMVQLFPKTLLRYIFFINNHHIFFQQEWIGVSETLFWILDLFLALFVVFWESLVWPAMFLLLEHLNAYLGSRFVVYLDILRLGLSQIACFMTKHFHLFCSFLFCSTMSSNSNNFLSDVLVWRDSFCYISRYFSRFWSVWTMVIFPLR